jgi:hypothetical protein
MRSNKSETASKWGLRVHILCYVVVSLVQVVLWWLFTPEHFFWPLWPMLGWGIGLAFHIWAVYSPSRLNARH